MGISLNTASILARELAGLRRGGKVLTLGVQGVEGDLGSVRRVLGENGLAAAALDDSDVLHDAKTQFSGSIHQTTFFKLLGYSQVESVDIFPDEDPTYVLDLGMPVPDSFHDAYDLVYDGGTLEHVFDVRQALFNVARMLAPGGMVIHHVPVNGYVDHGFYQFSPILFQAFYVANGFREVFRAHHYKLDGVYHCERLGEGRSIPRNGIGEESLVFYAAVKPANFKHIRMPVNTHLENAPIQAG